MPEQLFRERWDSLTLSAKMSHSRRLAWDLPSGFLYHSVQSFQCGGLVNDVARYTLDGKLFCLVPGGEFTIGRPADCEWRPTPEEQEYWGDSAWDDDLERDLKTYIASVTLRPRVVVFPTMLVEAEVEEYGWDPIQYPAIDHDVRAVVEQHFTDSTGVHSVDAYCSGAWMRVARDRFGKITAKRDSGRTQAEVSARLKRAGFRFPSSDEWEYLCGEGSQTLYRWGDHAPLDRDPNEFYSEALAVEQEVRSGSVAFPSGWREHMYPNSLGVTIARNPYYFELVDEPHITRGGDGGSAICSGGGRILSWLTLATSYFEPSVCTHDPGEPIEVGYTIGRRVLELN